MKTLAAASGRQSSAAKAATAPRRAQSSPAIRLVVLDVGGTIIEDRGDVSETLRSALANQGITTPAEISEWRGASKREIIRHFVERQTTPPSADRDKLAAAIYQDFSARLSAIYRTVPPIAGAEDAIRNLRQSGYLLATTTGFDREIAIPIFHRLGW